MDSDFQHLRKLGNRLFAVDVKQLEDKRWFACIFEFPPHMQAGACTSHFLHIFNSQDEALKSAEENWQELKS